MTPHIATLAAASRLPKGPCRVCDRGAVKRKQVTCRGGAPLNGRDAAAEFSRHLRPWARAAVLSVAS